MLNGVHRLVRSTHEDRVLRALREHGALSRGELAERVGLSRTTLSEITADLLRRGAIVVAETDARSRTGSGRPAERLALDPRSGQFLGVDFGHRRVHAVIADAAHEVLASGAEHYPAESEWPQRIDAAFALIDRLCADSGAHLHDIQGVGIGVPGPYSPVNDRDGGGWGHRSAATGVDAAFAARFDARLVIDNNTRFAALAEAIESDSRHLLYLRLGDGVGGGLVIDGHLVTGAHGFGGELGHVTVEQNGRACRCGKRGCLESVASVPAILAECRARGAEVRDLDELRRAVGIAHPVVEQVLREAGAAVGRVLGGAAMVLNPSEVVVAGELVRLAPPLLQQVHSTLTFELFPLAGAAPTARAARLSDDGGARGAIAALLRSGPSLTSGAPAPVRPFTRSLRSTS
ncbi:ROK family transcriptional regulator [Microbacterium sp. NPDC003461]